MDAYHGSPKYDMKTYEDDVKRRRIGVQRRMTMSKEPEISIRNYLEPGDVEKIVHMHGSLYSKEYGFDQTFEQYVAAPLTAFAERLVKSRNPRERIWIVEKDRKITGCCAVVEHSKKEAQLRWLLLRPEIRGICIGRKLIEEAISFARERGYSSMFLLTVDVLRDAAKLVIVYAFEV